MLTLSLITLFACNGEKEDTAIDSTDTATTEETDTEETDTEETDTEETDEPAGTAQVRVVHASPDAPAVDIFVNGEPSGIEGFTFKSTTGFIELPSGDYSFAVAPAGATFDEALPITLDATLASGGAYTAVAHGYLDTSMESNGFALSPFVNDLSTPNAGTFKVQVIHAAAASAFAKVDLWNITDPDNAMPLIPDFDYGEEVTTELPTGIGFVLGIDVDADAQPDAVFDIPDSLSGFVAVYAINDVNGNPSLLAHFEDGTNAELTPRQ